jgi:hypothetical protein
MGFGAYIGRAASPAFQGELMEEEETGLPAARKQQFRRDDVLYAGGVLLIGLAFLIGYICAQAGVPPTNPYT